MRFGYLRGSSATSSTRLVQRAHTDAEVKHFGIANPKPLYARRYLRQDFGRILDHEFDPQLLDQLHFPLRRPAGLQGKMNVRIANSQRLELFPNDFLGPHFAIGNDVQFMSGSYEPGL